jgi:hypothetical protein
MKLRILFVKTMVCLTSVSALAGSLDLDYTDIDQVNEFIVQSLRTQESLPTMDGVPFSIEYEKYIPALKEMNRFLKYSWVSGYIEKCERVNVFIKKTFGQASIAAPYDHTLELKKIAQGANADDVFGNENIIIWAIETGNEEAALRVLGHFSGNNIVSKYGKFNDAPLAHAVIVGMPRVVKKLLDLGVDPNQRMAFQGTALHWAVCMKNLKAPNSEEIYNLLLGAGANPDIANEAGITAAYLANPVSQ